MGVSGAATGAGATSRATSGFQRELSLSVFEPFYAVFRSESPPPKIGGDFTRTRRFAFDNLSTVGVDGIKLASL
eukprot:13370754-Heterocapsa_arctica.AAC.1